MAAAGCASNGGTGPDLDAAAAVDAGLGFGQPCSAHRECASGLCLASGICSKPCADGADCPGGGWTCEEVTGLGRRCRCVPAGREVCNGRDDDCDTTVDNDAPCPAGETCIKGPATVRRRRCAATEPART